MKNLMKINNPLRAKKFVIKYSKTLNRQFLEIKVLEGPTIPLEAACAYVIMVSLIYRERHGSSHTKEMYCKTATKKKQL